MKDLEEAFFDLEDEEEGSLCLIFILSVVLALPPLPAALLPVLLLHVEVVDDAGEAGRDEAEDGAGPAELAAPAGSKGCLADAAAGCVGSGILRWEAPLPFSVGLPPLLLL